MYFNQNSDAGLSWPKLPDTRSSWFRSMILLITGKTSTMSNHQSTYPQTSSHLNTAQFHQKVQCGEYQRAPHVSLLLNLIIISIFSISCFVLDLQIFSPVFDSPPVIRQIDKRGQGIQCLDSNFTAELALKGQWRWL